MARKTYQWKDPRVMAVLAQVGLWSQGGLFVLLSALSFGFGAGANEGGEGELTGPQAVLGIVALITIFAFLFGLVTTPMWIFRANKNAHVLKPHMQYGPWKAILFYVVPVAFLWMPFEAMAEIWDVSAGGSGGKRRKVDILLRFWWGAFLAMDFLGVFGNIMRREAVASSAVLDGLQSLAWGISAGLLAVIVRRITRAQIETYNAHVFSDEVAPNILQQVTG